MSRPGAPARDIAALVLGGALLLLPGLGSVDLFNPDEPREAEIVREMSVSRDLLVPHFNGCAFLEKPPLFYWAGLLASRLPGLTREAQLRLPSFLAALGLLVITWALGRELADRRTGRAAALLLLTTFQFWWLGRRAILDMTLAFFIGLTLLAFLMGHRRPGSRAWWFLLAGAGASGAALTKGLIGLLIPGVVIVAYLLWRRQARLLFSPMLLAAGVFPLIAVGAWAARLAARPEGSCYLAAFFVDNHIKRFLGGGAGGHRQPPWYYLGSLFTDFLPWVLFLPIAIVTLWPGLRLRAAPHESEAGAVPRRGPVGRGGLSVDRATRGETGASLRRDAFLHAWLLPPLVVLSAASSKRGLYLLPLAPAAALLVAIWWRRPGEPAGQRGRFRTLPAIGLFGLGLLISVGMPATIAALVSGESPQGAAQAAASMAAQPYTIALAIGIALACVGTAIEARRNARRGAAAAVILTGVMFFVAGAAILQLAEPRLSARNLGEAIQRERSSGATVGAFGLTEGALGQFLFYSEGTLDWIRRKGAPGERACTDCQLAMSLENYLSQPGQPVCLLREEDLERLPPRLRQSRVLESGRVGGSRYVLLRAPRALLADPR